MFRSVPLQGTLFRVMMLLPFFAFGGASLVGCGSSPRSSNTSAATVDIPLADAHDPATLASGWVWYQGESPQSAYKLDSNGLVLSAGSHTQQWGTTNAAPYLAYPIEGDFVAQTKLDFTPGPVQYWAGIGIMSVDDPTQWVRLVPTQEQSVGLTQNGGPEAAASTDFPVTTIYLKIQRRGNIIAAYYSKSGDRWLPITEKYEYRLPKKVKVYLVALTLGESIHARFSKVQINPL